MSLTVGANKDSRLLRSFNEKGAQKVDKLGDRAVFEVIGSGLIVSGSRLTVLAGDRIVALSIVGIDVETAKQMRPALEKLVRRVLERL